MDIETNLDKNNDDDDAEINNKTNTNEEQTLLGGLNTNQIGITNLPNELGKIISTVPICKISNIIQWIIRKG